MSKTVVIYHRADYDGIFCREIARKFLPDATLIGWDYGDLVPTPDVVSAEDTLYMLDISVEGLMGHPKLIWIDHHKSAMEKFTGTPPNGIPGYRIDGVAACRLAYQWFEHHTHLVKSGYHNPDHEMHQADLPKKQDFIDRIVEEPLAVRLAGEYDIWDKRDSNAELFQHGLRRRALTDYQWGMLLDNTVDKALHGTGMEQTNSELICHYLLERGHSVKYVKDHENAGIIKAFGFDVEFEGLKFLACNHARFNSHLFTAGLKPEHEALLGFNWDGPKREWRVSLYHAPGKEHHDLSSIAVKYGGGGHKGACGFRTDHLRFLT